jgi:hypothetical protein
MIMIEDILVIPRIRESIWCIPDNSVLVQFAEEPGGRTNRSLRSLSFPAALEKRQHEGIFNGTKGNAS